MAENTENKYLNKVPPHDNDAEQAVLACMLFDNEGAQPMNRLSSHHSAI